MCMPKPGNDKKMSKSCIIKRVLARARTEGRLTCGLLPAVNLLEHNPEDILFCVVAQTRPGDAALHMQAVLLQAFCYENDIPVIEVDSSEKLAEYCAVNHIQSDCFCAVITRTSNSSWHRSQEKELSSAEQCLANYYENTLNVFPRPVIQLLPPVT